MQATQLTGAFTLGAAVGALAMWLLAPAAVGEAPAPSLGAERPAAAAIAADATGAAPPKLPTVQADGSEAKVSFGAVGGAAGQPGVQVPGAPGGGLLGAVEPEGKGAAGGAAGADGAATEGFSFTMFRPPSEIFGEELIETVREGDPRSAKFAKAFKQLIAALGSETADEAYAARQLLESLINRDELLPHHLSEFEQAFADAEVSAPERRVLAALIARARADEPGIRDFLEQLQRSGEYASARSALHALDHPATLDPAVDAWRRNVIKDASDSALLRDALSPSRVERWTNRQNGGEYVTVIRDRLAKGDLEHHTRGIALRGLATAGVHAPDAAARALDEAAQRETEPKLANYARDAARLVRSGAANSASLQKAWHKQFPPPDPANNSGVLMQGTLGTGDATKK